MFRNIFNTFANCFKIPELKSRIFFTVCVLAICRLMAYIVIPGINGQALSYSGHRADQDWTIVYWIWPVRTGDGTRYERVILYLQNTAAGQVTPPGGAAEVDALARHAQHTVDLRLAVNRAFLVAFARSIVSGQRVHHDFDAHVTVLQAPNAARAEWLASARAGGRAKVRATDHARWWHAYTARLAAHRTRSPADARTAG